MICSLLIVSRAVRLYAEVVKLVGVRKVEMRRKRKHRKAELGG